MDRGLVAIGSLSSALAVLHQTRDSSDIPKDADSLPSYRVYGASGLMSNGTGYLAYKDTGTITGATNASPIVVTSANHKLSNGQRITISGVGGNTAANSTYEVANVTTDTFELSGSTGNGAYTSGGTWHVSGLYEFSFTPTGGNGFAADGVYTAVVKWQMSGDDRAETFSFLVV